MIRPRMPALALAAVLLGIAWACEATSIASDLFTPLAWAVAGVVIAANALDIACARRLRLPGSRTLPQQLWAGTANVVRVELRNPHRFSLRFELADNAGPHRTAAIEVKAVPQRLKIPARHGACFSYELWPAGKGAMTLGECWLYLAGPLGLWEARHRLAAPQRVQVGPNVKAIARMAQPARAGGPLEAGITAPAALMFWLDTGPAMHTGPYGERPWDQAIEALLALASVALAHGARVGLHSGAGPLAAAGGPQQLHALHAGIEALPPAAQPLGLAAQGAGLLQHSGPQDLVIVLTSLPAHQLAQADALEAVGRQRRLWIADFAERGSLVTASRPVHTQAQARAWCQAVASLGAREEARYQLALRGLEVIQPEGEALGDALIKRYEHAR